MYDLTVIGNGIAANLFLLQYLPKNNEKVLQIYSEEQAPPCTEYSTGTVFLKGVVKGRSPLGDLILKSYLEATDFFKEKKPPGVNPATLFYICDGKKDTPEEFIRRFETVEPINNFSPTPFKPFNEERGKTWPGFILNPPAFRNYLDIEKKKFNTLETKKDLLTGLDNNGPITLKLLSGEIITTKRLLLCTGAYTKLYENIFPQNPVISNSKIVPGSYLEKDNTDLGESSFVLARSGHNLIYHAEFKKLIVGATHQMDGLQAPDFNNLLSAHKNFSELIDLELPPIESFAIKSGIRHRGVKKMPFWGRLEGEIYGIFSLYRNGLTFPFLAAKELSHSLL